MAALDQYQKDISAGPANDGQAVTTSNDFHCKGYRHVLRPDKPHQQNSASRAFNQLRYRSKGTQHVIVERVNVESGGQAIVGNVSHGGGTGDGKS